jgi:hypothetical protein
MRTLLTIASNAMVALFLLFDASIGLADERLWLDAKINGKRARLCFDSGSDSAVLFRGAAQRFGLKVFEPSTNVAVALGEVLAGTTEACVLSLQGQEGKARFRVIDTPAYVSVNLDGVVGWRNVRGNVLRIDAAAGSVTFQPKVPDQLSSWVQLAVFTNSDLLELEVARSDGSKGIVFVDTGTDMGVSLPAQQWQAWKAAHPHWPTTLKAFFTPADGLVAVEEAWATKFPFGPIVLSDVPIAEAAPVNAALGSSRYEGTLGLAALKRIELIVDRRQGVAYVRTKKTSPPPYQHNRLGAVFLPASAQSDELVARVVEGSPAEEAGVRTGDVLLKVDKKDVTKWSVDALSRFEMSPGTKVDLTLRRDGKTFRATATLRQIIPPNDKK